MKRIIAAAGLGALVALGAAARGPDANAQPSEATWSDKVTLARSPEETIAQWPELARAAARATIAKYGKPDEIGEDALVWYANGPWKKTIAHRRAWPHYSYMRDKDYLESTIGYAVPTDKLEDLTRFDKRLDVDQASSEMSSRSDGESTNYLALNLADEIIKGKRTVEDARDFYVKTTRLAAAGKSSPYLNGFMFDVRNDAVRDPWTAH
jgi:hypothetical protein